MKHTIFNNVNSRWNIQGRDINESKNQEKTVKEIKCIYLPKRNMGPGYIICKIYGSTVKNF